jgi:hypothetical protein
MQGVTEQLVWPHGDLNQQSPVFPPERSSAATRAILEDVSQRSSTWIDGPGGVCYPAYQSAERERPTGPPIVFRVEKCVERNKRQLDDEK